MLCRIQIVPMCLPYRCSNLQLVQIAYLTDALQDANGGSEVADVEDRQLEINVGEVSGALGQILTARLTRIVLLTRPLCVKTQQLVFHTRP